MIEPLRRLYAQKDPVDVLELPTETVEIAVESLLVVRERGQAPQARELQLQKPGLGGQRLLRGKREERGLILLLRDILRIIHRDKKDDR